MKAFFRCHICREFQVKTVGEFLKGKDRLICKYCGREIKAENLKVKYDGRSRAEDFYFYRGV
jgi:transposase-like protein